MRELLNKYFRWSQSRAKVTAPAPKPCLRHRWFSTQKIRRPNQGCIKIPEFGISGYLTEQNFSQIRIRNIRISDRADIQLNKNSEYPDIWQSRYPVKKEFGISGYLTEQIPVSSQIRIRNIRISDRADIQSNKNSEYPDIWRSRYPVK